MTFHHNWRDESSDQRMPRVRFGDVDIYNDFYGPFASEPRPNTYAIAAGYEARRLIECNYFYEAMRPHVFFSFGESGAAYQESTAEILAQHNTYVGVSEEQEGRQAGQGDAFVPPYPVTVEDADEDLRDTIVRCAGATLEP